MKTSLIKTKDLVNVLFSLLILCLFAGIAIAADLRVMNTGLGSGTVISTSPGINCRNAATDCNETYASSVAVTLTATADTDAAFVRWEGDCSGSAATCTVTMNANRSVRAVFDISTAIPPLIDFTAADIQAYLTANPDVDSVPKFIAALPTEYKQNWILMSRSESLQTGTAQMPRILMPSVDARFVFSLGLSPHSSYPGAHPNAIEYMQWDAGQKNFRFHEIILAAIPELDPDGDGVGVMPSRSRGVAIDDEKCSKCHSTRNVLNTTSSPATDGVPPGVVQVKNKPNWDTYDSWGGMSPFNRDRIYQGSVEAAAFRKIFNLWTWRDNDSNDFVRSIIEQLQLQPSGVPAAHAITRTNGGANDGHINFAFDSSPPVLSEPAPTGTTTITTNYRFDNTASGSPTTVQRDGAFITLHHSLIPTSDEGRGVRLFDTLGGLAGTLNQQRIADEVKNHRWATGSVPIDVRPVALAISKGCFAISGSTVTSSPVHSIDLSFFNSRNGMTIDQLVTDTRTRVQSIPRRKADIQKLNLDRTGDVYLASPETGLIQEYGAATSFGVDTSLERIRQEVFRRSIVGFSGDSTVVMGGNYVDRELYGYNINRVALYRYFLEPLGVSVDKWSMGVRGRSRTYSFADVFATYANVFEPEWSASLGLLSGYTCDDIIPLVNSSLSSLPPVDGVPTYTDVQRILNKSCIECHGGLDYPPYQNLGSALDLSEDPDLILGTRMGRSHNNMLSRTTNDPTTSFLFGRITDTSEDCPYGMMPCGGPPLSKVDIETIRRWIEGGRPSTAGDPHIKTVDGINYDFQAAGEFVLLRDPYMEIQARQTAVETSVPLGPNAHTGLSSCVSINTAVAVRIGQHRITYQPTFITHQPDLSDESNSKGLQLRIDGKLAKLGEQDIFLAAGGRIIQTSAAGGIQIEAPGGTAVVVTPGWWEDYQVWYMNIDVRHARATQGIMGAIATGNWLPALPDDTWLGPRPQSLQQRYTDLYEKFGAAWRVTDATSLFDYTRGTSTDAFTIESWPLGESPKVCKIPPGSIGATGKVPVNPLPREKAKQYCQGIVDADRKVNCIADVMVTGEPGFAQTYLATERVVDLNKKPTVPALTFPDAFQEDLVLPIAFTWNRSNDEDNDTLIYWFCTWPVTEQQTFKDCQVLPEVGASQGSDILSAGIGLWLLILWLLVILLISTLIKKRYGLAILALIAIVIVLIIMFISHSAEELVSAPTTMSQTLSDLESGKAYYWKVIAEDGQGGTTESEMRRFSVKK